MRDRSIFESEVILAVGQIERKIEDLTSNCSVNNSRESCLHQTYCRPAQTILRLLGLVKYYLSA